MADKFNPTLQENCITLLAYNNEHGKVVASIIEPDLFEGEYRTIANRVLDYWRKFGEAPKVHLADLFDDILSDQHNRKAGTYRRILTNMLALSESMNTDYVIDQVRQHSETQRIKAAILKSAEEINAKQQHAVEEIRDIWNRILRDRQIDFDPGVRLSEYDRVLASLAIRQDEFRCGIRVLDDRFIVPYRGGVMLLLGAAGKGKSWGLIHIGKAAVLARKKVVHVTLEMGWDECIQRYYQSLFSVSKRKAEVLTTTMKRHDGKIEGFDQREIHPAFTFQSPHIRDELETRIVYKGQLFNNLIVKRFPSRSLSIDMLRGYLDNLEVTEKFIPDMVILDYIGITKTNVKEHRLNLGRNAEDFRGLCVERNVAGVTAHQISKAGAESLMAGAQHIAEDWSMIGTHDQIITYSCTDVEHEYGLGRLFVSKARSEEDRFGCIITQSYDLGQFCLDSHLLKKEYYDLLNDLGDDEEEEPKDEDDGEE